MYVCVHVLPGCSCWSTPRGWLHSAGTAFYTQWWRTPTAWTDRRPWAWSERRAWPETTVPPGPGSSLRAAQEQSIGWSMPLTHWTRRRGRGLKIRSYLFQCNPHRGEGHHLENVELQQPPEKLLDLRQDVGEPSGQDQQPVCHQSPLTWPQLLCWSGGTRAQENSFRNHMHEFYLNNIQMWSVSAVAANTSELVTLKIVSSSWGWWCPIIF